MEIAGHCKGNKDVRHVDCGGQLAICGEGVYSMPLGFGFKGSKFVVDKAEYKGYSGFCMKCGAEGIFIRKDIKPKLKEKRIRKYDVKGATK